jgi:hypothetical protein
MVKFQYQSPSDLCGVLSRFIFLFNLWLTGFFFLEALILRNSVYNVHYLGKEFSFFVEFHFENDQTASLALKERGRLLIQK